MVSPDFFASDYCQQVEVKTALKRHEDGTARVIPIICRKVDWEDSGLDKIQSLPTDAEPIKSWLDHDEAYFNIVQGLKQVIRAIRKK
jgi:hypothetical protein